MSKCGIIFTSEYQLSTSTSCKNVYLAYLKITETYQALRRQCESYSKYCNINRFPCEIFANGYVLLSYFMEILTAKVQINFVHVISTILEIFLKR